MKFRIKKLITVLVLALLCVQTFSVSAFEAHVINVTAKIVDNTPKATPPGGEFCINYSEEIILSSTLEDSYFILYTKNGSDPACGSNGYEYQGNLILDESTTIKAVTCHNDKQSATMSWYFEFKECNNNCDNPVGHAGPGIISSSTAGDVVLNEFLPNPLGCDNAPMPGGEWIELYNRGGIDVDVNRWVLYDDSDHELHINPTNTNTGDTIVSPLGYLVVYINGGEFSLNNVADSISLYDGYPIASSTLIDFYAYDGRDNSSLTPTPGDENIDDSSGGSGSSIPADKSFARIPDGADNWVDPIPTPGAQNILSVILEGVERPIESRGESDDDEILDIGY